MPSTINQEKRARTASSLQKGWRFVGIGLAACSPWLLSLHAQAQQLQPRPTKSSALPLTLRNVPLRGGSAEANPGVATLPNGRRVTPAGEWIKVAPYPFALAVRPDDGEVVLPCIGWPFSLNVISAPGAGASVLRKTPVRQIPAGRKNDASVQVMTGVAYSPDGKLLYDTTGDTGAVDVYAADSWKPVARVPLDGVTAGRVYTQSFAASLVLSSDGRLLYVVDQGNWRVVVIDTATHERVASLPTGANPSRSGRRSGPGPRPTYPSS